MRFLLDFHTFLWFVAGDARLSDRAREAIEELSNDRYLSMASVWEMAIKFGLSKLRLEPNFHEFLSTELERNLIGVAGIELPHLYMVAELPFHHRDRFDRLLIAQCLVENWSLVSADESLDVYGIRRLW